MSMRSISMKRKTIFRYASLNADKTSGLTNQRMKRTGRKLPSLKATGFIVLSESMKPGV